MANQVLNLVLAPQFVINITHEMGGNANSGFTIVAGIASTSNGGGANNLNELTDVNLTSLVQGDIISYDNGSSKFINHQLTTSKITNIDENSLADGALLLYDGGSSKYKATVTLDNPNTLILGGSF